MFSEQVHLQVAAVAWHAGDLSGCSLGCGPPLLCAVCAAWCRKHNNTASHPLARNPAICCKGLEKALAVVAAIGGIACGLREMVFVDACRSVCCCCLKIAR
jgi:hypothetical protein